MQDKLQRNSTGSRGSTCQRVFNNKGRAPLQNSGDTGYKVIKAASIHCHRMLKQSTVKID